jgi:integrase
VDILKSAHGSVRPYTRHLKSCPHRRAKDHNSCSCPKWLYVRTQDGQKKRASLNTPSWAEAQRIAADRLRAIDPEIAAARAVTEQHEARLVTVKAACDLWMERVARDLGKEGSYEQYSVVSKELQNWAKEMGILHIREITSLQLANWYGSRHWTKRSLSTRRQRWVMVRSMFRYWHEHKITPENVATTVRPVRLDGDHVQGPYTDEQVEAVMRQIDSDMRVRTFVLLLLHTGCDVMDAVLFEPARIRDYSMEGREVSVYRYKRVKTNVEAVVPLPADIAATLRAVPRLDENPAAMPFRDPRLKIVSDRNAWSLKIRQALKTANVRWVELPTLDDRGTAKRKQANCKQFRHTFAVRQLRAGQRPEEVAKMLGHVNTDMVRRHYAPWVEEMDHAHISRVVKNWTT